MGRCRAAFGCEATYSPPNIILIAPVSDVNTKELRSVRIVVTGCDRMLSLNNLKLCFLLSDRDAVTRRYMPCHVDIIANDAIHHRRKHKSVLQSRTVFVCQPDMCRA